MKKDCNFVLCAVVVAVLLNLLLPQLVFALKGNNNRNNRNNRKNVFSEMVNMLVHHAETPVSSSIIVAVIVAVSVGVCCCY